MIKKLTAVITAAALAAAFTACGNKKKDTSSAEKDGKKSAGTSAASDSSADKTGEESSSSLPESTAKVSFDIDTSVWLDKADYEAAADGGSEDKLELDKPYSDDETDTMYVMSDGSPSDGAAVITVSKPVYNPVYTKDSVPGIVNSVNEAMSQDIDMGKDFEFISCKTFDTGDLSAVYVVQKDKAFGIKMKIDQYQFFEDGDVFTVTLFAPEDRYDELKPDLDSIINSIKIDH